LFWTFANVNLLNQETKKQAQAIIPPATNAEADNLSGDRAAAAFGRDCLCFGLSLFPRQMIGLRRLWFSLW
jgi:hypothetical protein